MSHGNEKIITNCGSPEKYLGKNQVFFRYSAAHSTITINNTRKGKWFQRDRYKQDPRFFFNRRKNRKEKNTKVHTRG